MIEDPGAAGEHGFGVSRRLQANGISENKLTNIKNLIYGGACGQ